MKMQKQKVEKRGKEKQFNDERAYPSNGRIR